MLRAGTRVVQLSLACSLACAPVGDESEGPSPPPVSEPVVEEDTPASSPDPAAAVAAAAGEDAWFEPLPPLKLATADEAQKARASECMQANRVQEPDVTAAEVLAAAKCMGDIPLAGHEIRLYKHLMTNFPDAPEVQEAARVVGTRYEQIGIYAQAVDAYVWYLRHWPANDDARGLGQRAVCLAHALGLAERTQEILGDLDRFYGREGFERPADGELDTVCAEVLPPPPRPGG